MALASLKQSLHCLQGQLTEKDDGLQGGEVPQRQSARLAVRHLKEQYWLEHNLGGGLLTALQLEMATDRQAEKLLASGVPTPQPPLSAREERIAKREAIRQKTATGRGGGRASAANKFPVVRLRRMGLGETEGDATGRCSRQTGARSLVSASPEPIRVVDTCDYDDGSCATAGDYGERLESASSNDDNAKPHRELCSAVTASRKRRRPSSDSRNFTESRSITQAEVHSRKRLASLNARYYIQVLSDPFVLAQLVFGTPPPTRKDDVNMDRGRSVGVSKNGADEMGEQQIDDGMFERRRLRSGDVLIRKHGRWSGDVSLGTRRQQVDDISLATQRQQMVDVTPESPLSSPDVSKSVSMKKAKAKRLPKELQDLIDNVRDIEMSSVTSRLRQTKARYLVETDKACATEKRKRALRPAGELRTRSVECTCSLGQIIANSLPQPKSLRGWIASDHLQVVLGSKGCCRHLYNHISKQTEKFGTGDIVLFWLSGDANLSRIGRLQSFWAEEDDGVHATVQEFYRPELTMMGRRQGDGEKEVFASQHRRDIDVDCIASQCYVTTIAKYCRFRAAAKRVAEGRREMGLRSAVPLGEVVAHLVKGLDAFVQPTTDPDLVFFCRYNYDHRTGRLRLRSENFARRYARAQL